MTRDKHKIFTITRTKAYMLQDMHEIFITSSQFLGVHKLFSETIVETLITWPQG